MCLINLWRDMDTKRQPTIYEWQVLPFGTTCSPVCATYALQTHVHNHTPEGDDARFSIDHCFYVDNWLQSFSSEEEAKKNANSTYQLLLEGGFELREWASNKPNVIQHFPSTSLSNSSELWFTEEGANPEERTLGLLWQCASDTLRYKQKPGDPLKPTMRNIYKVLARQYDPLGFIIPYTTRAKIIVRELWDKPDRSWDDPNLPGPLLTAWKTWESEFTHLAEILLPRCYAGHIGGQEPKEHSIHVFCDASEQAYGAVAYLRSEDQEGNFHVSFLAARSRIAPKKQLTIPRLELCAALAGAELAAVLRKELTINIATQVLWSDSTTVLHWLKSRTCKYVVGNQVTEIGSLSDHEEWRYVATDNNPADDITRGKSLQEIARGNRWSQGPAFLTTAEGLWPEQPQLAALAGVETQPEHVQELRKAMFYNLTMSNPASFNDLIKDTALSLRETQGGSGELSAADYRNAEQTILKKVQEDCYPIELKHAQKGENLPKSSSLRKLAPEYHAGLLRVGGRLSRCQALDNEAAHPVLLSPAHPYTKLLIQKFDEDLRHPGPERVFAEIRRKYWITRGREAVKKHQKTCLECQRWKGKPDPPRMADLPESNLRVMDPPFYSAGMDCFGPMTVKSGRRVEKRWGLIFKCLTTRAIHLELLTNMSADSFLMALSRFKSRRGRPFELRCDRGTNFVGGSRELREAFMHLKPELREKMAPLQVDFVFNPPAAPHFGGSWEREIRSVKNVLRVILGTQTVSEEVLTTALAEIEAILNSRPLGYVSSDPTDPNPVTPNDLLMGRADAAMPQVIYPEVELHSRRRWRHSQVLADQFWKRYVRNFLPTLQTRQKWTEERNNMTKGDRVIVLDPQLPRAFWPVGEVKETKSGKDGRVRTAVVQVGERTYTRPVARLIRLPELPATATATREEIKEAKEEEVRPPDP